MNPTELNTLRRSLWLTVEQAGQLNNISPRSWRYLEDGTRPIPQDIQDRMRSLDATANAIADAAWDEYGNLTAPCRPSHNKPGKNRPCGLAWHDIEAVLLRYPNDHELARAHPEMAGLPASFHAAAIDRARILLEAEGSTVRIVTYHRPACDAWLAEQHLPDNPAGRAAWAASATDPAPGIGGTPSGEDFTG